MWDDQANTLTEMFRSADGTIFRKVLHKPVRVLFLLLPRKKELTTSLSIDYVLSFHVLCNECYVHFSL